MAVQGAEYDVVLVHAHHVRSLATEDANHAERNVVDADFLADRRHAWEQVSLHGIADHAHLVAVADIAVGEHLASGHVLPITHHQERRRGAGDLLGNPVAVPVDNLRSGADDRGDSANGGALAGYLAGVLGRKRQRTAGALLHAAGGSGPGKDHQRVGPHAGDTFLQGGFRALADLRHGDDCGHGNDDAQGRQSRPHLISPQRPERGAPCGRQQRGSELSLLSDRRIAIKLIKWVMGRRNRFGGGLLSGVGFSRKGHGRRRLGCRRRCRAVAATITVAALVRDARRRSRLPETSVGFWRNTDLTGIGWGYFIALDSSVHDANRPMGISGYVGIVRHQYDGDPFGVELLEHPQDFDARVRIEVAGRLVGQKQCGAIDQCPADRHPLLLSSRHLRRLMIGTVGQSDAA